MGVDTQTFYDKSKVAIVPMAFCFPGYNAKGADLPPPSICARTWRQRVLSVLGKPRLTLLVGGAAQRWHSGPGKVTDAVANWRAQAPAVFPLPHPSWRNNAWLANHGWFTDELLPALRQAVRSAIS